MDSDNTTKQKTFLEEAAQIGISNETLKQEQAADPQIQDILSKLHSGKASQHMQAKHLIDANGILYFNADIYGHVQPVLFLPQKYRWPVLSAMHDNLGHLGVQQTYHIICQSFYWPQLYNDVTRYCTQCATCQWQMLQREKQPMQASTCPKYPFQKVAVDLVGPVNIQSFDGNQYILTYMDMLTSWVEAIPLKSKDTKLVGRLILDHIICQFGCPEEIISDNGGEFCSKVIDEICSELSIRKIKTAPYHAQANGKLENFHKLLISSIKKNIQHDAWEWDKVIQKVLFAYCVTLHLAGGYSPFFALMGRDPVVPIHTLLRPTLKYMGEDQDKYDLLMMHYVLTKLAKNMTKLRQKHVAKFNHKLQKHHKFSVGDRMYIFNHTKQKLDDKWLKGFIIIKQNGRISFVIKHQKNGNVLKAHANDLHLQSLPDIWTIPDSEHVGH